MSEEGFETCEARIEDSFDSLPEEEWKIIKTYAVAIMVHLN